MTRENMVFRFQDERAETVENHRNPPESSKLNRLTDPTKNHPKNPSRRPFPTHASREAPFQPPPALSSRRSFGRTRAASASSGGAKDLGHK